MVDYNKTYLRDDVIQYSFLKTQNGLQKFTFRDFIRISEHQESDAREFVKAVHSALEESRRVFKAYFWECPPVSRDTADNRQFEFVTVKAPSLLSIRQNYSSFKEKFYGNKVVCSFLNLGHDAVLVSPAPESEKDFSHLAKFNSEADSFKIRKFWEKVAEELGKALSDHECKWLSTNGLGVHYLHVRIDDYPKYYQYQPYKVRQEARLETQTKSDHLTSHSDSYDKTQSKTGHLASYSHLYGETQPKSANSASQRYAYRDRQSKLNDMTSHIDFVGEKQSNTGQLSHPYGETQPKSASSASQNHAQRERQTTYSQDFSRFYGWSPLPGGNSTGNENVSNMEIDQTNTH